MSSSSSQVTPPKPLQGILKDSKWRGQHRPVTPPRGPGAAKEEKVVRPVTPPRGPPPRASELSPKGLEAKKQASSRRAQAGAVWGAQKERSPVPALQIRLGDRRSDWEMGGRKPKQKEVKDTFAEEALWKQAEEEVRERSVWRPKGQILESLGSPWRWQRGGWWAPKGKERKGKERKGKRQRRKAQGQEEQRRRQRKEQEPIPSRGDWQEWKTKLKGSGETPGSMRLWTVRVVRHLLEMPSRVGLSWRKHTLSPSGSGDAQGKTLKTLVYPLPLPAAAEDALKSILDVSQWKGLRPKDKWFKV